MNSPFNGWPLVPEDQRMEILRRWLDKVDRSGDCWMWKAGKSGGKYGQFHMFARPMLAHRIGVMLAGVDPGELFVCHKCDVPLCVRPSHMFLGTHKDNMADAAKKGRMCGENHPLARLTNEDIIMIRASMLPQIILARRFGVRKQTISSIKKRRLWGHV